ncbi:MAG: hypothetical protein AMXMBFR81_30050 [Chthonomonas sp.]
MVVGSHVMAFFGRPRFTEDLDLWVRRTEANGEAIMKALREFGFEISEEQARVLVSGRQVLRIGAPPNQVDFLAFLGSRDDEMAFERCLENALEGTLFGVPVRYLSKEDFITSKLAAGRPRDLRDVAEMKEFKG